MSEAILRKIDVSYCGRLLEEMVAIPSVVNEERELAEYLKRELEALGLETRLQEVEKDRPNVIAVHEFPELGPMLMFNGHMDTVPVCEGWTNDPFEPVVKEGRLYGLGAADMKAGIACAIAAVRALVEADAPLRGTLAFTGVVGEEAYSRGAKALLKTEMAGADAVIIGEPYSGQGGGAVPLGITGKVLYDITVKGRSAHGFSPEKGVNAVDEAARILVNMDKLELRSHPRFKGNFCTLKIEGGYKVYSVMVPERCRVEVNRLLVPGETVESAIRDMEKLIDSLGLEAEVEVATKPPFYEAFEMDPGLPIIKVFTEAYREVVGREPDFGYSNSITDGNVFTGEGGIPSIHMGPSGGGVHQADEYVTLEYLEPVTEIFTRTAAKFLG